MVLDKVVQILMGSPTWIILVHEKPDGDTLGSGSALYQRALTLGKDCVWGGPDPLPRVFSFLAGSEDYSILRSLSESTSGSDNVVIVLDTSNPSRTISGLGSDHLSMPVINIDHHGDNSMFGSINVVDDKASAVGEIILDLYARAGWDLSPGEAEALFAAISTDTGFFRFPCTSNKTFQAASLLLSAGADIPEIYKKIYENRTLGGLRLWGEGLRRARIFQNGLLCTTFLRKTDFENFSADREESENLVNALLSVSGVFIAALILEDDGFCRVSIRTRAPVDARFLAEFWGGGGHIRASGCRIVGTVEDVENSIIESVGLLDAAGFPDR